MVQSRSPELRLVRMAETRLKIARSAMDLLVERGLADLGIDEICARSEVSRSTFTTHFGKRDGVFLHVVALWRLERQVEALERPLRGTRAIRRLFDRALDCRRWPGTMRHLSAFLAMLEGPAANLAVDIHERQLLYPGRPEVLDLPLSSLAEMMERHIGEARSDGELPAKTNARRMSQILLSLFYGAPIMAVSTSLDDLPGVYRLMLDDLLRGTGG